MSRYRLQQLDRLSATLSRDLDAQRSGHGSHNLSQSPREYYTPRDAPLSYAPPPPRTGSASPPDAAPRREPEESLLGLFNDTPASTISSVPGAERATLQGAEEALLTQAEQIGLRALQERLTRVENLQHKSSRSIAEADTFFRHKIEAISDSVSGALAQSTQQLEQQRAFFSERLAELESRVRQMNTDQNTRATEHHSYFTAELEAARDRLAKETTRTDESLQKLEHRTVGSLRKLQGELTAQGQALSERLEGDVAGLGRRLEQQNSKFVDICIGVDNKMTKLNQEQLERSTQTASEAAAAVQDITAQLAVSCGTLEERMRGLIRTETEDRLAAQTSLRVTSANGMQELRHVQEQSAAALRTDVGALHKLVDANGRQASTRLEALEARCTKLQEKVEEAALKAEVRTMNMLLDMQLKEATAAVVELGGTMEQLEDKMDSTVDDVRENLDTISDMQVDLAVVEAVLAALKK